MKKTQILVLILTTIQFFNCKNASDKIKDTDINNTTAKLDVDYLEAIEAEQAKDLENAYLYVLAPNGLSLRKTDFLDGEKILTIPFGAKVKQMAPVYTIDFTVENIEGSMMEVQYKEQKGYAFSGFLSKFPLLNKDERIEDYVTRLKAVDPNVSFSDRETEPDFHEGIVETLLLPSIEWHQAFYLAKAQYAVPESFNFPGHKGANKELIEQPDKEDYVWSSTMEIVRNEVKLDTISFYWRAEGTGTFVEITKPKDNQFKIEYTGFAD